MAFDLDDDELKATRILRRIRKEREYRKKQRQ